MRVQRELTLDPRPRGFHLITREVVARAARAAATSRPACCTSSIQHTSASLTLNENASPDVRRDFESWFNEAVPEDAPYWTHTDEGPDDMPAHIKASLLGPSLTLPVARRPARARHLAGHLPLRAPRPRRRPHAASLTLLTLASGPASSGSRFSANAFAPSWASSEPKTPPAISPCFVPRLRLRPLAGALDDRLGRGERERRVADDRPASSRAPSSASPGSTSRLTMPISAARSAPIGSPVSASSMARWYGIRCGSRNSPPAAATRPRLTSGMPKRASREATIRSHDSAISKPPASA